MKYIEPKAILILLLCILTLNAMSFAGCGKKAKHTDELDTRPPTISECSVEDITSTSAAICWETDEPATSQVEYGLTSAYAISSATDSSLVRAHRVNISDLEPNTAYHYRVISADGAGNKRTSQDYEFTTLQEGEGTGISASDVLSDPSAYDGETIEVSGQAFLSSSPPKVLLDGQSGMNLSGDIEGMAHGFYSIKGTYHADSNNIEIIESIEIIVDYLPVEEGKELAGNLVPVSLDGLIATVPKEVADELTAYLSFPGFPQDMPIYPYVVYSEQGLYLVLSDHFDIMPTEFTLVYGDTTYHLYFCAGEIKGTLVQTPLSEIDFGLNWSPSEFGGVIIADTIQESDPADSTVADIINSPSSYAFERVSIDASYVVATATIDYSELKLPFGIGLLADEFGDFFSEDAPRLEAIDPERSTWQLREAEIIGTVLYPTEEVLQYLDYSAPLTREQIEALIKPVIIVDTIVDEIQQVASVSQLNPLTGDPSQYWGKVVEFEAYALGYNLSLKAVASAIASTEIPVNVNVLAVGIADGFSVGSQLAIAGLNNDLVDLAGEAIFGKYKFQVAVTQVPEQLVAGLLLPDTAFFILSKESLPYDIPTQFYNLTVAVSPSGSGIVVPSGGLYPDGMPVLLTAVPAPGYVFDYWIGDLSASANPATLQMDSHKSVTAHFRQTIPSVTFDGWYVDGSPVNTAIKDETVAAKISLSSGNSGQYKMRVRRDIDLWPDETVAELVFDYNGVSATKSLFFGPAYATNEDDTRGYHVDLQKDGVSVWTLADSYPPRLTVSATVTYSLDVEVNPPGAGTVILSPSGGTYAPDTMVELAVIPALGYAFDYWNGGGLSGSANTTTIIMDSNKSVTAYFTSTPPPEWDSLGMAKSYAPSLRFDNDEPWYPVAFDYDGNWWALDNNEYWDEGLDRDGFFESVGQEDEWYDGGDDGRSGLVGYGHSENHQSSPSLRTLSQSEWGTSGKPTLTVYYKVIERETYVVYEYWFYYVYNSYPIDAPVGVHEHDWEPAFVLVAKDTGEPYQLQVGHHGFKLSYDTTDRTYQTDGVYVALGGHGMAFELSDLWPDEGNGDGRFVLPYEWTLIDIDSSELYRHSGAAYDVDGISLGDDNIDFDLDSTVTGYGPISVDPATAYYAGYFSYDIDLDGLSTEPGYSYDNSGSGFNNYYSFTQIDEFTGDSWNMRCEGYWDDKDDGSIENLTGPVSVPWARRYYWSPEEWGT